MLIGVRSAELETYAHNYASKISDARDRVYQEKLKQYQQEQARQRAQQQQQPASSGSSGGYSGSSYGSSSSGSLDAAAARSRSDHQATMQRYERENRQIRQEIRAIDRKYGR
jgi:hypothetical protein